MKKTSPSLDWCIVRCDNDDKWWVDSISDSENWDIEDLGIIDPKTIHLHKRTLGFYDRVWIAIPVSG